jgi:hypothetical protein
VIKKEQELQFRQVFKCRDRRDLGTMKVDIVACTK